MLILHTCTRIHRYVWLSYFVSAHINIYLYAKEKERRKHVIITSTSWRCLPVPTILKIGWKRYAPQIKSKIIMCVLDRTHRNAHGKQKSEEVDERPIFIRVVAALQIFLGVLIYSFLCVLSTFKQPRYLMFLLVIDHGVNWALSFPIVYLCLVVVSLFSHDRSHRFRN